MYISVSKNEKNIVMTRDKCFLKLYQIGGKSNKNLTKLEIRLF